MTKLFQACKIDKPMVRSIDATYRAGDPRVPVEGTLQYRWAKNMATLKPELGRRIFEHQSTSVNDHPSNQTNTHFIMTGGTKRMHMEVTKK